MNFRLQLFLFLLATINYFEKNVFAVECKTRGATIQSKEDVRVAEDDKAYSIINLPGFEQNTTFAECLPDQSCSKGSCQQDFKLHQFLSVPYGKELFQLNELQFRFFKIPYGCKCVT